LAKQSKGRGGSSRGGAPRKPRAEDDHGTRWPSGIPESIIRAAERGAAREETRRAVERDEAAKERETWTTPADQDRPRRVKIQVDAPAEEGVPAPAAAWTGVGVDTPEAEPGPAARRREPRTAQPPAKEQVRAVSPPVAQRRDPSPAATVEAEPEPEVPAYRTEAATGDAAMTVEDLRVFYGAVQALKGMSFYIRPGETVAIIGSNGAGKTTTLKTISGVSELLKTVRGKVTIFGERVESWPAHKIARLGVAHSPEGRKIFPNQTVRDNLLLGAYTRSDSEIEKDIEEQYERFPILGQRRAQAAGLMSGGEQQMLAIARALMSRPKIILLDEPSMGLAPLIVKQIFQIIEQLKAEGKTILLVEQMAFQTLGIADRAYVLETGAITMEGTGAELLEDPRVKEAYLGA
jgi:branched-chain amino acid transport system ATP-binding protein